MSGRKMLREIMTINDIYNYAEPIMEMLREEYGSYDGDSLDEVRVEEPFAQRLAARGYDVRAWGPNNAPAVPPAPARPTASGEVVPVTVVRRGRPAANEPRSSTTPPNVRPIVPSSAPSRPASPLPAAPTSNAAVARPAEETPEPRRRGRPPGSGRATSSAASSEIVPQPEPRNDGEAAPPRRRGRPPGSKNRTDQ